MHGGGYVLYPGEAGAGEAMLMAGYGGFRVVSVDYRMAPDFPFPAALDDAIAVWRALVEGTDPRRMAIFGSSAGGGLTLAMVLRARAEGLPLPAAIAPGTPWADLTGAGDSIQANAFVDNVLVSDTGWVGAAASLYAAGRDLRDPLLSPIYGDFPGFPPAILTSGTRDLFLSHTVRTHRKLRQAGVEATLQVFEGQSHAQFLDPVRSRERRRRSARSRRSCPRSLQHQRAGSARKRRTPAKRRSGRKGTRQTRRGPSASSMRSTSFHFAMRSERANEPTLSWPASQPTARWTMVTSSVSPERAETMVPQPSVLRRIERGLGLGDGAGLVRLDQHRVAGAGRGRPAHARRRR